MEPDTSANKKYKAPKQPSLQEMREIALREMSITNVFESRKMRPMKISAAVLRKKLCSEDEGEQSMEESRLSRLRLRQEARMSDTDSVDDQDSSIRAARKDSQESSSGQFVNYCRNVSRSRRIRFSVASRILCRLTSKKSAVPSLPPTSNLSVNDSESDAYVKEPPDLRNPYASDLVLWYPNETAKWNIHVEEKTKHVEETLYSRRMDAIKRENLRIYAGGYRSTPKPGEASACAENENVGNELLDIAELSKLPWYSNPVCYDRLRSCVDALEHPRTKFATIEANYNDLMSMENKEPAPIVQKKPSDDVSKTDQGGSMETEVASTIKPSLRAFSSLIPLDVIIRGVLVPIPPDKPRSDSTPVPEHRKRASQNYEPL